MKENDDAGIPNQVLRRQFLKYAALSLDLLAERENVSLFEPRGIGDSRMATVLAIEDVAQGDRFLW